MKRMCAWIICLLAGSFLVSALADTLSEAAAVAVQREAEERYRRLAADLQSIQETQEVLLKRQEEFRQKLDKLADEVRNLKDDQSRSGRNAVTRDEFRNYVEKLKELDEKRESDKKLILENLKDLAKIPVAPAVEKAAPRRNAEPPDEPAFIYTIKKNDRLLDIVAEYNDYFQKHGQPKITVAQVLKANPGLKADLLIEGRKIRIPNLAKDAR